MRIGFTAAFGVLLGLLAISTPQALSQDSKAGSQLEVKINYSGSGTVDEKHKAFVVLWDSPEFVTGQVMPVELQAVTSKQGTATFQNVKTTPAYVSVAFDPKGEWDGQSGPPPEGTSLGLYTKGAGKPEPIELKPGKTVTIEVPFDDTIKMQAGKANR